MYITIRIFSALFLWFFTWQLSIGFAFGAGYLHFEQITTKEGLPHSIVYDILQDKNGFLWFATGNGLVRYDGYEMRVYNSGPDNGRNIGYNSVVRLLEDKEGNIWIVCTKGINRFDPVTEEIKWFLADKTITGMAMDTVGGLWVSSIDSIYKFNKSQSKFQLTKLGSESWNLSMGADKNGMIWLMETPLGFIDPLLPDLQISHWPAIDSVLAALPSNHAKCLLEDKDGTLWFGFNWGIGRFSRSENSFKPFFYTAFDEKNPSFSAVSDIFEDSRGNLIVGTPRNGLLLFNRERNGFFPQSNNTILGFDFLQGDHITKIVEDFSGNLWVASMNVGLNKMYLGQKQFNLYTKDSQQPCQLSDNIISALHLDKNGILWIGTWNGGVTVLDRNRGTCRYYKHHPLIPNSIGPGPIGSITEDSFGKIWVGTWEGSFSAIDPLTRKITNLTGGYNQLAGWVFWSNSIADKSGGIWIGSSEGLEYLNIYKDIHTAYLCRDYPLELNRGVCAMERQDDSTLWLGTLTGITRFYIPSGTFTHFFVRGKENLNYQVLAIRLLANNRMAVGTQSGGVFFFDVSTRQVVKRMDMTSGLPSNNIYGIYPDGNGKLWMSTGKGICLFDEKSGKIIVFDEKDGLQGNEFRWNAHFKSRKGEIYFGGSNGLNSFFPDSIRLNTIPPRICFTGLKLNNQEVLPGDTVNGRVILQKSLNFTRQLTLTFRDRSFTIEFAALHFANSQRNKYEYILAGFDQAWIRSEATRRFATYTNLSPGKYTFKVRASNNDGFYCEPISIDIRVLPPWYQTWWALSVFFLVFLGMVLATRYQLLMRARFENKIKIERLERRQQALEFERRQQIVDKQKELDNIKVRFFMNISHEFRTPLTLILGPVESLLQSTVLSPVQMGHLSIIQRNAKRLLRLVNQLLDLRKLESGTMKLHLESVDIVTYIGNIFDSFRYLAERHQIEYRLEINPERNLATICRFDPEILEKILYNLISNAFKYTPDKGTIIVALAIKNTVKVGETERWVVEIKVIDNGLGISPEYLERIFERFYRVQHSGANRVTGTGIGLALTSELVNLCQGSISVQSQPGKGSTFCVEIPYNAGSDEGNTHASSNADKVDSYPHITNNEMVVGETVGSMEDSVVDNGNPVLLLVDDNQDLRWYLKQCLTSENNTVIEAGDGKTALELAISYIPDLIIADIMMPEMDGLQMSVGLKQNPLTRHIPIIMLSARSTDENQLEGLHTGADDYIAKPFNITILIQKVKNLLLSRERLKQKFLNELGQNNVDLSVWKGPADEKPFYDSVVAIVDAHIDDPTFDVTGLARELTISRTQLYRKFKGITDLSVNEFIVALRLNRAAGLLISQPGLTVSQVAFANGFSDPNYFSTCFKKQFSMTPTEFRANKGNL